MRAYEKREGRSLNMKWAVFVLLLVVCALGSSGCNVVENAPGVKKLVVEEVGAYKPDLPAIPIIPKPAVAETFSDGSYSVYGLRKKIRNTVETKVTVTAYIAKIYEKPDCQEGQPCHVLMPHLFLADEQDEDMDRRLLRLVGYAQSFREMEEAEAASKKRPKKQPETEDGEVPLPKIVWDWKTGHKYRVSGLFTRRSASGFMDTDGMIEFESYECLDCVAEKESK
jgi:hypothetical protein